MLDILSHFGVPSLSYPLNPMPELLQIASESSHAWQYLHRTTSVDRYAYHSRYTPDQDRDTSDDGSVSSGNRQKIFDTVQSFFRVYNPVFTEDVRCVQSNNRSASRQYYTIYADFCCWICQISASLAYQGGYWA